MVGEGGGGSRAAGNGQATFGELLVDHRRFAQLTQEKLGELAGVSTQTVSNIERGLGHKPRANTVRQLAKALGLDPAATTAFHDAASQWRGSNGHAHTPVATNGSAPAPAPEAPRRKGPRWPMVAAVVMLIGAGLWWVSHGNKTTGESPTTGYRLESLGTFESQPALIAQGPGGILWFTAQHDDSIWRVPRGGAPEMAYRLPPGSHPFGIATTADGSVWFTEGEADGSSGDAVDKLNPDGTLAHRTTFPKGSEPTGIAVAPDGRVWITAYGGEAVYWLTPDGQRKGGPFPVNGNPNRIVVGPDGNIWVTIATSPKVVVLSTEGNPMRDYLVDPGPTDIAVASDGRVWITSHNSNSLQSIDPNTGRVSEPRQVLGGPGALAIGPDGNFWFTQLSGRAVSVLSPTGEILRTVPIRGGTPFGISNGPDGDMWFTVQGVVGASPDGIGRIPVRA